MPFASVVVDAMSDPLTETVTPDKGAPPEETCPETVAMELAVMLKLLLAAGAKPMADAVSTYVPGVLIVTPVNKATPLMAFTVALTPAGEDVTVTGALLAGSGRITLKGASVRPATVFDGCAENDTAGALRVTNDHVAEDAPPTAFLATMRQ